MPEVIPGAEAFEADGGPAGVLLLHGFTGNPHSMRGLAQAIARAGHAVSLPRLPGHGTTIKDLMTTGWSDWLASAEAAYADLATRCQRVAVAGLSMGGGLAAWMGVRHPEIAGLICINPAIEPNPPLRELVEAIVASGEAAMDGVGSDIADPEATEIAYEQTPVEPLLTMLDAGDEMEPRLADIGCPVLIMTSPQDHVVPPSNSDYLAKKVSGPVERVSLDRSYHVATLDYDKDLIEARALGFLDRVFSG